MYYDPEIFYGAFTEWSPQGRKLGEYTNLDDAFNAIVDYPKGHVMAYEVVYKVWQLGRPESTLVGKHQTYCAAYDQVDSLMVPEGVIREPFTVFYRSQHSYAIERQVRPIQMCFLRFKYRYFS